MKPKVEPYIMFNGLTAEALEFYQSALGANVLCAMKFSDAPENPGDSQCEAPPGFTPDPDKIMHAAFTIGDSMIMASDGCGEEEPVSGISLSISTETKEETERYFHALSEGGEVTMPLGQTFWSPLFGMVKDKFGVHWMVGVNDPNCMG